MAIDCDARAFGIQPVCSYPLGEDFRLDVHITEPPESGYWGFQAKVSWDNQRLSYQPLARAGDEALSEACVVVARTHYPYHAEDEVTPEQPAHLVFACVPLPLPEKGLTTIGPALRFAFRCVDDGVGSLGLVAASGDVQLATHFLGEWSQPLEPDVTGSRIVCGDGGQVDSDADGCTDAAELSAAAFSGGQRDPLDYWDFYDTPDAANTRDKVVTAGDISRVVRRFGAGGDLSASPLSPPPDTGYHSSFDRGGRAGAHTWNQAPADGSITASDVAAAVSQLGHSCT
jgi:hypothetical protein